MSNKISGKSHSHSSYHAATPSRNTAKSSPSKNSSSSSKNSTSTSSKATTRPAAKTVTKPATKPVTKTTTKSNTSTSSSKKTDKKISSNEVKKNSTGSSKKDVKSKEKNIAKNFISLNSKQSAKPKKPHKPVPTSNQKIETGLPFPTIPIAQCDFYIKAIKEWYKTHAEAPANGNYTGFTSENLNSYDSFIPINNPIQKESPNQLNSSPVNFHPINPGMTKPNLSNNTSSKKNEPSKNIIISSKDVVVLKTNTGNKTPVSKKQEKKKVFFNSKKEEVQWTPKKEKVNKSVLTTKATIKQVISKTNVKNKHASISQLPIEKNKQTNSLSSWNKNNLFNHIRSEKKKALNPLSSLIPEKQTITEIINKQEAKRTLSFAKTLIASLNQATKRKSHTTGYYASLEKEKQLQEQEKQKRKKAELAEKTKKETNKKLETKQNYDKKHHIDFGKINATIHYRGTGSSNKSRNHLNLYAPPNILPHSS